MAKTKRARSGTLARGGKKTSARSQKTASGRKAAKRELVAPRGDARYVRRAPQGQFSDSDDVGRASAADRRTKAKAVAKHGQGDRGDRRANRKRQA
jgi:hypothetical protein